MTKDEFKALVLAKRKGGKQPLRDICKLMDADDGFTPDKFAASDQEAVERQIRAYLNSLPPDLAPPASMAAVRSCARAMIFTTIRLFEDVEGAPRLTPLEIRRVIPEPIESRPKRIADEVASWKPSEALTTNRKDRIRTWVWQYVTLCRRAGMPLAQSTSLSAVTSKDALEFVLPMILDAFAAGTIPPFLSAIKQLLSSVLGPKHVNTLAWAANVRAFHVSQGLSLERIESARDLTSVSADGYTVWEVPDLIATRARQPGKRTVDRNCLLACAFATALGLDVLGLAPGRIAELDLRRDISGVGQNRTVRWRDERGVDGDFPMGDEALMLLDELIALRTASGLNTTWLFPNRSGRAPKTVSSTVTYWTNAIEAALRARFTIVDLQDALAVNGIDTGLIDINELSDVRAAKHVRSTRARFKLAFDNPLTSA